MLSASLRSIFNTTGFATSVCLVALQPQVLLAKEFKPEAIHVAFQPPPQQKPVDILHYHVAVKFNQREESFKATETITMRLSGNIHSLVLDCDVEKVLAITSEDGVNLPYKVNPIGKTIDINLAALSNLNRQTIKIVATYLMKLGHDNGLIKMDGVNAKNENWQLYYTFSEPTYASRWLISHQDPRDRATIDYDFTIPSHWQAFANGHQSSELQNSGSKTVSYSMTQPIPTYIMAFTIGEYEVQEETLAGGTPLKIIFPKGMRFDNKQSLNIIKNAFSFDEHLLGSYPWPSLNYVLIPNFTMGGEENVGIIFQDFVSFAKSTISIGTTAHEIAHQWFGDLVTVESWNDLWIKEGVAELIGELYNAQYHYTSQANIGHVLKEMSSKDKVIDYSAKPEAKYNSGPYQRAAWILNQLRDIVGNATFFGILRQVLADKNMGYIGSEEFISYFINHLSDEQFSALKNALHTTLIPTFEAIISDSADGGKSVVYQAIDPNRQLISAPMILKVAKNGDRTTSALGQPVLLSAGEVALIDVNNVHNITLEKNSTFVAAGDSITEDVARTLTSLISSLSPSVKDATRKFLQNESNLTVAKNITAANSNPSMKALYLDWLCESALYQTDSGLQEFIRQNLDLPWHTYNDIRFNYCLNSIGTSDAILDAEAGLDELRVVVSRAKFLYAPEDIANYWANFGKDLRQQNELEMVDDVLMSSFQAGIHKKLSKEQRQSVRDYVRYRLDSFLQMKRPISLMDLMSILMLTDLSFKTKDYLAPLRVLDRAAKDLISTKLLCKPKILVDGLYRASFIDDALNGLPAGIAEVFAPIKSSELRTCL